MTYIEPEQLIHFKTTSGEELIAKLVFVDDETQSYFVKDVLVVDRIQINEQSVFTLRSWMLNQFENNDESSETKLIQILPGQIMAFAIPNQKIVEQYESTINYYLSPEDWTQEFIKKKLEEMGASFLDEEDSDEFSGLSMLVPDKETIH